MAQQLQVHAINAPGFYGLNTQDSPLDLDAGYALTANNCVIDKFGRVGARKGWVPLNDFSATLGTATVRSMGFFVDGSGVDYTIVAGNNKLFRLVGTTLVELTYDGGAPPYTITGSNWKFAPMAGAMYMFQAGHVPIVYDPAVSTTTFRRLIDKSGSTGAPPVADIVLTAFGRLWADGTATNKSTVYWSELLAGHRWQGGGSLDLNTVWPNGMDTIVALGTHNNLLFIFGRRNIIIYEGANDPSTMKLQDQISGIGCTARDSIVKTGTDIIFLSDSGLRSIARTIQEKSSPIGDLSRNVRDELQALVRLEDPDRMRGIYSAEDSLYLLLLPNAKIIYCFDTRAALQNGALRVTTWSGINAYCLAYNHSKELLMGFDGYVGKYSGYTDNGQSYRMVYYTNHADLGAQSVTSILKRYSATIVGGNAQNLTLKWAFDFTGNFRAQNVFIPTQNEAYFGQSEYNVAEYAGGVSLNTLYSYPTGTGKIVQLGVESTINGSALSIQKLEVQAKNGKIV